MICGGSNDLNCIKIDPRKGKWIGFYCENIVLWLWQLLLQLKIDGITITKILAVRKTFISQQI